MIWRFDEIVTFEPSCRKIVKFWEELKKTFTKPGSVTTNLECDVLLRKCAVAHFRPRHTLKTRFRFWEFFGKKRPWLYINILGFQGQFHLMGRTLMTEMITTNKIPPVTTLRWGGFASPHELTAAAVTDKPERGSYWWSSQSHGMKTGQATQLSDHEGAVVELGGDASLPSALRIVRRV